ncbi:MAG: AmmeMemoRadiSam system protein B [Verrucomicrobiota bacterium]
MKKSIRWLIAGSAIVIIFAFVAAWTPKVVEHSRPPAVAGLFYPSHPNDLSSVIQKYLSAASKEKLGTIRGLVCPHAGYEFSGIVAAKAYKQLAGSDIQTVIVLAPSHYAAFKGAYISNIESYTTPLGTVKLSPKAKTLATREPFTRALNGHVQRPDWWAQSPARTVEKETPDTWEHALEVQIPFIQTLLPQAEIIPIVFGQVDPQAVADSLAPILDNRTVVIASSDLSHYHPYELAQKLDRRCVQAILDLNADALRMEEACGQAPILTLMALASPKGWKTKLLDYQNSGDTSGDKSRGVVGYAAIALYEEENASTTTSQNQYSPDERKFLLELARKTLVEVVAHNRLPEIDAKTIPEKLKEVRGCFVTLTIDGQLRGCIGHITPQESLYRAVMDNAQNAAVHDHRFPKVQPAELNQIKIEISVLTPQQKLEFSSPEDLLSKLRPHIDGVVLHFNWNRQSTYLPQVWEHFPQKEDFLNNLSEKAGLPASTWKTQKDLKVFTYQVEAFLE